MPGEENDKATAGQRGGKLEAYRGKRDLRRSGEPSGRSSGRRRRSGQPRFVVQQHDARTMHYDFRLEADGVLKSWSVPKGPSQDPADKRLAVQTEDHPLDYEDFEGVIPPGDYGAGPVIVWDAGTYDNETTDKSGSDISVADAVGRGHVSFVLHGRKLRGGYSLTRFRSGRQPGWLLVKKADPYADKAANPERDRPESVKSGKDIGQLDGEK